MQVQGWPNFLILKLSVMSHGTDVLTSVCIWNFITIEASVYIFVSFPWIGVLTAGDVLTAGNILSIFLKAIWSSLREREEETPQMEPCGVVLRKCHRLFWGISHWNYQSRYVPCGRERNFPLPFKVLSVGLIIKSICQIIKRKITKFNYIHKYGNPAYMSGSDRKGKWGINGILSEE